MQKNKYFIFLLSGVGIVVILTVLTFLLFKPVQKEEMLEAEAVRLEQAGQELLETEVNQSESTDKTETEVHGSGQTAKKTPDTKDTEPEQPQYIGRIVEGYVEPKAEDIWPPERLYEWQLALKDTYQSNIQIIRDDLYTIDIDAYEWFKYTDTGYQWHKGYQWICYAILTYYDGDVPCDYYVTLDNDNDDSHNYDPSISTMIFEVQTRGEKPLNI